MGLLPEVTNDDDVDRLRTDTAVCGQALAAVAAGLNLGGDVHLFCDGSALVGRVGASVIKMFAPFDEELARTEQRVLAALDGELRCPTPAVEGAGEFEGWPYIVMTALEGVPLSTVWERLAFDDRRRLCTEMGEAAAQLHALPVGELANLPPSWRPFIERQRATATSRQQRRPIPESWSRQIAPFLDSVELMDTAPALLHTELMRAHFLGRERAGLWELTGLIDFEPAMVGEPQYDFASVGLFVSSGEPGLFGAFLAGYGHDDGARD